MRLLPYWNTTSKPIEVLVFFKLFPMNFLQSQFSVTLETSFYFPVSGPPHWSASPSPSQAPSGRLKLPPPFLPALFLLLLSLFLSFFPSCVPSLPLKTQGLKKWVVQWWLCHSAPCGGQDGEATSPWMHREHFTRSIPSGSWTMHLFSHFPKCT